MIDREKPSPKRKPDTKNARTIKKIRKDQKNFHQKR
jgi:hypothetical protein